MYGTGGPLSILVTWTTCVPNETGTVPVWPAKSFPLLPHHDLSTPNYAPSSQKPKKPCQNPSTSFNHLPRLYYPSPLEIYPSSRSLRRIPSTLLPQFPASTQEWATKAHSIHSATQRRHRQQTISRHIQFHHLQATCKKPVRVGPESRREESSVPTRYWTRGHSFWVHNPVVQFVTL